MPGAWEQPRRSVLVGILTRELVATRWAIGFRQLQLPQCGTFTFTSGQPFDTARNGCVQHAINGNFEWMMFLDDDTIPPADAFLKLAKHNVPIISGLYIRRSPPVLPVMMRIVNGSPEWVKSFVPDSIQEVDYVGAGCLLVKTDVFKSIPYPWFQWQCHRTDLPQADRTSEDFTFCTAARKAGYKILVDTSVKCIHVGLGQSSMNGFEPLTA